MMMMLRFVCIEKRVYFLYVYLFSSDIYDVLYYISTFDYIVMLVLYDENDDAAVDYYMTLYYLLHVLFLLCRRLCL